MTQSQADLLPSPGDAINRVLNNVVRTADVLDALTKAGWRFAHESRLPSPSREAELREALEQIVRRYGDTFRPEHEMWRIARKALAGSAPVPAGPRVVVADDGSFQVVEPKPAEWIEWKGGDWEGAPEARVSVRLRNGHEIHKAWLARCVEWRHGERGPDWNDIIAYKLASPQPDGEV